MSDAPTCDPTVLRHLQAELAHVRGGHLPTVQADMTKLSTETARVLLWALRDSRTKINRMRSQPWRRFP